MKKKAKRIILTASIAGGLLLLALVLVITRPYPEDHWRNYIRFAQANAEEYGLAPDAYTTFDGYWISRFRDVMKEQQNVEFKDYFFLTVTTDKGIVEARTIGFLGVVFGPGKKRTSKEITTVVERSPAGDVLEAAPEE